MIAWVIKKDRKYWSEHDTDYESLANASLYKTKLKAIGMHLNDGEEAVKVEIYEIHKVK